MEEVVWRLSRSLEPIVACEVQQRPDCGGPSHSSSTPHRLRLPDQSSPFFSYIISSAWGSAWESEAPEDSEVFEAPLKKAGNQGVLGGP